MENQDYNGRPVWLSRKAKLGYLIAIGLCALAIISAKFLAGIDLRPQAFDVKCSGNLKLICVAGITWALDHNTNRLPDQFILFTNLLGNQEFLRCPLDKTTRSTSDRLKSSYILTGSVLLDSTNVYIRCPFHKYVGFADGTVDEHIHH
jgi:hypothetical protein